MSPLNLSGSTGISGVDGSAGTPAVQGTDTNTGISFPAADTVAVNTGGSERVRCDSSGRVGIGTTTVGSKLHVYESGGSNVKITSEETGSAVGNLIQFKQSTLNAYIGHGGDSSGNLVILNAANTATTFSTNNTERARIDSSGRLLVGTSTSVAVGQTTGAQIQTAAGTSSVAFTSVEAGNNGARLFLGKSRSGTYGSYSIVSNNDEIGIIAFAADDGTDLQTQAANIKAEVDGTPGANDMPGRLVFSTTADGASSPTERVRIESNGRTLFRASTGVTYIETAAAAGTTDALITGAHSSGTVSLRVWSNGNIQNTNNSYGSLSDIKLKENIVDANSQWDDIKALQVRKYNFKEGQTHTQIGLVAQEVELVSPGLVSESPDRDEDGNDLGTVTKSVNYSVLYMKAVKALQEAMERIEALEAKVAALESA